MILSSIKTKYFQLGADQGSYVVLRRHAAREYDVKVNPFDLVEQVKFDFSGNKYHAEKIADVMTDAVEFIELCNGVSEDELKKMCECKSKCIGKTYDLEKGRLVNW